MQPNEDDMITDFQALIDDIMKAAQFCLDSDFNKVDVLKDYKLMKGKINQ